MHSRHLIALLLLLASAVHSQAGISKETFFTLGFSICSEELSSSGTCCPQGEACLDTGLCFGGAGLLNRRACVDIWESSPYLTFCENMNPRWAHVAPCRSWVKAIGSEYYWCGLGAESMCDASIIQFGAGGVKEIPSEVVAVPETVPVTPEPTPIQFEPSSNAQIWSPSDGKVVDANLVSSSRKFDTIFGMEPMVCFPLLALILIVFGRCMCRRRSSGRTERTLIAEDKSSSTNRAYAWSNSMV